MKVKCYAVTAIDCGDSCNGHPSCLGIFKTEEEAKAYVKNDMEDRCDQLAGTGFQVDFGKMEITDEIDELICAWSIDAVEADL